MYVLWSSLSFLAGLSLASNDTTELRREKLLAALQQGGYTVILRHARTDRSFNEQRDPVPERRVDQRNLTDDGIRDAALMGVVFRKYRIQFAEVISSPMYRCVETAEYSVGTPTRTTMVLRVFPSTPEQAALVKTAPRPGTNRLLVTHHFVIETHVPGIRPGDIGESEAAVVRHTADGDVVLVGRITLGDWQALANPGTAGSALDGGANAGHGAAALHGPAVVPAEGTPVTVPDTHAGHIAREYVAAFNTGRDDRMREFLETWMLPNAARTLQERLDTYRRLFTDHGPLTVVSIHETQALQVTLGMRSRRGTFRLTVTSATDQPMRGQSVTFTMQEGTHR